MARARLCVNDQSGVDYTLMGKSAHGAELYEREKFGSADTLTVSHSTLRYVRARVRIGHGNDGALRRGGALQMASRTVAPL